MSHTRWLPFLLILAVLVLPAQAAGKDKVKARDLMLPRGFPDVTDEQLALTEVPYAKGAPAVVLMEAKQYEWEGLEFVRDRYFRRLKILSEDAIEDYGSFQYELYGNWRVKEVDARTILPDGTVVNAKEGINREKSEDGIQVIQISFPQVQVGAILDLDIKLVSESWTIAPWTIQEWIPILETRFVLLPPLGLRFRIAPARLPGREVPARLLDQRRRRAEGLHLVLARRGASAGRGPPAPGGRCLAAVVRHPAAVQGQLFVLRHRTGLEDLGRAAQEGLGRVVREQPRQGRRAGPGAGR